LKPFKTETFKTAIGLTNLFEIGKDYEGTKPIDCANKAYKKLSKIFRNDLLFGLSSETVRKRFSDQIGHEVFSQETLDFEECLSSKKCCFTGKAGSIREVNELLDKKVKLIKFIGKN